MRIQKNGHEIASVDDWFRWAPPKRGALHWRDDRSAKELAKSWFRTDTAQAPFELTSLLNRTFDSEIVFDEAEPECTVELDDFEGETRNCDLVVLCHAGALRMSVSVEAKADERFGDFTVGEYYDKKLGSSSNVPKRIEQLSTALFGRVPNEQIRSLRYQLVHSAAASLIAAERHDAGVAILLVHEFISAGLSFRMLKENAKDWAAFIRAFPKLADAEVRRNQILGPVSVPGGGYVSPSIPLYFGKIVTQLCPAEFWIVAIDHELQLSKDSNDTPQRSERKDSLQALLSAEIPKRNVRFIAEESKIGKKTIASALADSSNPKIPWRNISMTDRERDRAGITEALKNRPGHPDHETMQTWIEYRIPEDEIREGFFVEQTLRHGKGATSILMLLGDMHVDAVAQKLEQMGHRVSTDHSLFPVKRWE
jgi:hypothetical protein